jgi:hypothetical protein
MERSGDAPDAAVGFYQAGDRSCYVTLERCGEALQLTSFDRTEGLPVASAGDKDAVASLFRAPRIGADRYNDWAQFEWESRNSGFGGNRSRVWRIAESRDWACFLGQSTRDSQAMFPTGAALWRGWQRQVSSTARALYWHGSQRSHLWLVTPFELPRYIALSDSPTADSLLVALSQFGDIRHLALDLGGTSAAFDDSVARLFPGSLRTVEPFVEVHLTPEVREEIIGLRDPSAYLPAVGAARALLNGPPVPLKPCGSLPEVAAVSD